MDRLPVADSPVKILFIHGAGEWQVTRPYARMLQQHGYEVISPDLPPYGLSYALHGTRINYELWITLLDALMERE